MRDPGAEHLLSAAHHCCYTKRLFVGLYFRRPTRFQPFPSSECARNKKAEGVIKKEKASMQPRTNSSKTYSDLSSRFDSTRMMYCIMSFFRGLHQTTVCRNHSSRNRVGLTINPKLSCCKQGPHGCRHQSDGEEQEQGYQKKRRPCPQSKHSGEQTISQRNTQKM